jgi:hypothetical protein
MFQLANGFDKEFCFPAKSIKRDRLFLPRPPELKVSEVIPRHY